MVAPTPVAAHLKSLLDIREPDLIVRVRVGQKLVVIELQEERDFVRVLPGNDAQYSKR